MSEDQEKPLKKYSWDEIKSHQSPPDSVWIVIHNKVYDVTEFMEEVRWPYCTELEAHRSTC